MWKTPGDWVKLFGQIQDEKNKQQPGHPKQDTFLEKRHTMMMVISTYSRLHSTELCVH